MYFGGVAFKYQRRVNDTILATKIACQYMDVVTTSGIGIELAYKIQKNFCFKFERKLVYLINKVMAWKKKRRVTFITPERWETSKNSDHPHLKFLVFKTLRKIRYIIK